MEEKVLELQKTKRDLAAAVISQGNSLIRNLHREDLELYSRSGFFSFVPSCLRSCL